MEPAAIPFPEEPRVVILVLLALLTCLILIERMMSSDVLHRWKQEWARSINKGVLGLVNINDRQIREMNDPAADDVMIERAEGPFPSRPLPTIDRDSIGTIRTLVNDDVQ